LTLSIWLTLSKISVLNRDSERIPHALILPVHPAPARGFSHMHPIGGLVTCTVEFFSIQQGFDEDRATTATGDPIMRHCFSGQGKHRTGQVFTRTQGKSSQMVLASSVRLSFGNVSTITAISMI
jgi:hypothetical protein